MTLKKGITEKDGNFKTITRMQAADLVAESLAFVDGVGYKIKTTDLGGGILLNNGNYANLVNLPEEISTATSLVAGESYVSTATASHVVPAASGGAPIKITWLDGTIMTLTSSSNISVTTDAKVTDTTWVFENFIQELTLVDTGTEWEIK